MREFDCPWCDAATAQLRAATGDPKVTATCTLHRRRTATTEEASPHG